MYVLKLFFTEVVPNVSNSIYSEEVKSLAQNLFHNELNDRGKKTDFFYLDILTSVCVVKIEIQLLPKESFRHSKAQLPLHCAPDVLRSV